MLQLPEIVYCKDLKWLSVFVEILINFWNWTEYFNNLFSNPRKFINKYFLVKYCCVFVISRIDENQYFTEYTSVRKNPFLLNNLGMLCSSFLGLSCFRKQSLERS